MWYYKVSWSSEATTTSQARGRLTEDCPGNREHVGVVRVVELFGAFAREFQVLGLVVSDGHMGRSVDEDVGGLKDGVGEETQPEAGPGIGTKVGCALEERHFVLAPWG